MKRINAPRNWLPWWHTAPPPSPTFPTSPLFSALFHLVLAHTCVLKSDVGGGPYAHPPVSPGGWTDFHTRLWRMEVLLFTIPFFEGQTVSKIKRVKKQERFTHKFYLCSSLPAKQGCDVTITLEQQRKAIFHKVFALLYDATSNCITHSQQPSQKRHKSSVASLFSNACSWKDGCTVDGVTDGKRGLMFSLLSCFCEGKLICKNVFSPANVWTDYHDVQDHLRCLWCLSSNSDLKRFIREAVKGLLCALLPQVIWC